MLMKEYGRRKLSACQYVVATGEPHTFSCSTDGPAELCELSKLLNLEDVEDQIIEKYGNLGDEKKEENDEKDEVRTEVYGKLASVLQQSAGDPVSTMFEIYVTRELNYV